MKVAIIMPLAEQRGGAELMLMHLLQANRLGPQVEYQVAFLEDGPMVAEARDLGYNVRVFPAGHFRDLSRQIRTIVGLRHWFKQEKMQGVMSWMSKAHLYAGPAAFLAGIPSVWWQHGIPRTDIIDWWVTRLPAKMVFCCSKAAQAAQQTLTPLRTTRVINPAVDLARFDPGLLPTPAEARRQLELPEKGPLIGIVCRLQRWKGVHVFLAAAAQVARSHPEVNFVVVGGAHALEPEYPKALAEQVQTLGLSEKAFFAGYQADSALWMQALDVVVHASVQAEPFGMVVIEALALGKLVIASKAGGPLEVVEEGVDGLLTEPGNVPALAAALNQVLEAHSTHPAMQKAARQKARCYGTDRLATDLAWNLQKILSKL